MFSVPTDSSPGGNLARLGYSRGNLAGRRVGGNLRLFITGSHADEWRSPIYEMSVPAQSGWVQRYDVAPPTMSIVKDWNAGVRGAAAPLYPNGQPVHDVNGRTVKGLIYDPDLNGLWYSYLAVYNVGPTHDPSIGYIQLNDGTGVASGYGPWRHRVRSPYTGGYGFHVPSAWRSYFGNRELVFGAETATRGAMGFSLNPTARPASPTTLPYDEAGDYYNVTNGPGNPQPRWSLDSASAVAHGDGNTTGKAYQRPANFLNCGWQDYWSTGSTYSKPRTYPPPGDNPAVSYDPAGNGGVPGKCNMDAIDTITGATFIDTGTKYGVVCFGVLVWPSDDYPTPHSWYGVENNAVSGTPNAPHCSHGQICPTGNSGTGYYASGLAPYWWIFDPAELQKGYNGTTPKDEVQPTHEFDGRNMHGNHATAIARMKAPTRWYQTGAYYDAVDGILYAMEDGGAGWQFGEPRGMVHAWSVG